MNHNTKCYIDQDSHDGIKTRIGERLRREHENLTSKQRESLGKSVRPANV